MSPANKLPRELTIDLDTAVATAEAPTFGITLEAQMPSIDIGLPGPTGPAGLVKITHGSNPNVARPDVPLVYWVGTVQPVNAFADDLLLLK